MTFSAERLHGATVKALVRMASAGSSTGAGRLTTPIATAGAATAGYRAY